jgi:hypothetical protein
MTNGSAAAELAKLAHQLGVDVDRLDCVAQVSPVDLRALRHQIGEAMFTANKHQFTTMATLARTVPTALSARISQLVLPPLLAARTAELFDPHHAAELVTRMSSEYLAEIGLVMDPARAPAVVAAIPPDRVALVGVELARRGEWLAMGAFVSFVSPAALQAAVAALDGGQLLRVGFVLDDLSRLDEINQLLSERQRDQLLDAAATDQLWLELDGLLTELDDAHAARLAQRYASAPPAVQDAISSAAGRGDLGAAGYRRLSGKRGAKRKGPRNE